MPSSTPPPTPPTARASISARLLLTPGLSGAENMALDEYLLRRVAETGPVLRVYTWRPSCVTLGYGQPASDVDEAACAARGLDITRRLTGGRAVLHHRELTYSILVEAERLGVGRSVTRAYGLLAGGLIRALGQCGLNVVCTPRHPGEGRRDPACFATTIGGDLSLDGRKLVGSAQCHRFGGILQHGSLPEVVDEELLNACLRRPPDLPRTWTCLADLGVTVTLEQFAEALADGFTELLGERPAAGELTAADRAGLAELRDKYASVAWRRRVSER